MSGSRPPRTERDWHAAAAVQQLREKRGLSRDALGEEISRLAAKNPGELYPVSGRTIHRIETEGVVPTVRIKFALAEFFKVDLHDIWVPAGRRFELAA